MPEREIYPWEVVSTPEGEEVTVTGGDDAPVVVEDFQDGLEDDDFDDE